MSCSNPPRFVTRFDVVLFLLLCVITLSADPTLTANTAKLATPELVTAAVRKELDPNAIAITDKEGNNAITIWFRNTIPMKATAEQVRNGLTYREIPDGTLIGVIQFGKPFVDFRKQDIKAGVYTMRFAVQPDTGDHTGTAPHVEFVLLVPADKDQDADTIEVKSLIKHSTKVIGGDHPAVMLLFPQNTKITKPMIAGKSDGVQVVSVLRKVTVDGEDSTLGFAIAVAGFSKTR